MASRRHVVGARRALSNSALVTMLGVREFPMVALFRRDHQQALYMQKYSDRFKEKNIYIYYFNIPCPPSNIIWSSIPNWVKHKVFESVRFVQKRRTIIYKNQPKLVKDWNTLKQFRYYDKTYTDLDNVITQDSRSYRGHQVILTTTQRPIPTTTMAPIVDCVRYPDR